MNSRKSSTRIAYLAKWKRFMLWATKNGVLPNEAPLPLIPDYLHHLKKEGLMVSSIEVHLAAVLAFHPPVNGWLVFSNPICSRFLKGLEHLYSPVHQSLPPWDLNLVLSNLMGPPFEPMATCSLFCLSWKVVFMVAITLARRVSEIRALTSELPYTVFFKDKVQL